MYDIQNRGSELKFTRHTIRIIPAVLVGILALANPAPPADAAAGHVQSVAAVEKANPALTDRILDIGTTGEGFVADARGLAIKINSAAVDGITLTKPGGASLIVTPPFAETAETGEYDGSGFLSYRNDNGSSTVTAVMKDGGVAIHSVIYNAASPHEYAYELGLPIGATIKQFDTGEVIIFDQHGDSLFLIAPPWARDAKGESVPTRYEVKGTTLVQVVDHSAKFEYPVVADPSIGGFYMSSYSWNSAHNRLTLVPTFAGGTFQPALVAIYGLAEVEGAVGNLSLSMDQQFICHCGGNTVLYLTGQTWDLETYRGTVSDPWAMFSSLCNW